MSYVLAAMSIPDTEDVLDPVPTTDGLGYAVSLIRSRGSDGATVWTAIPPRGEPQDAWTSFRIEGQHVVANSWSGYAVVLDLESGRELARTFTK
jgi:hypothetical protein